MGEWSVGTCGDLPAADLGANASDIVYRKRAGLSTAEQSCHREQKCNCQNTTSVWSLEFAIKRRAELVPLLAPWGVRAPDSATSLLRFGSS